ncbi:hypothetical protein XA68_14104 [Ophiocordyceps unilateralis]|uniref:Uncharacterized protein n=1 Tax=Ophiocordyceps unilateralis TaxID=268505 RepID=A0A2A9PB36_OPHUN|nr:hypothetical protein XA68_14104 [Ophiocordyceps unilateralis]
MRRSPAPTWMNAALTSPGVQLALFSATAASTRYETSNLGTISRRGWVILREEFSWEPEEKLQRELFSCSTKA